MSRISFPLWALGIARATAARSEDPYVQVGSVALRYDWSVIGVGYNGLPAGVDMPDEWWQDRAERRQFMIHAEVNALRWARPTDVLYVVTTHIPCQACMTVLGSFQVAGVYYESPLGEAHDHDLIMRVAEMNGIVVTKIGDDDGI
jgi:dCMP deaminase